MTPVYLPYRYSGYGVSALATPGSVQSGAPSCGLPDLSLCDGAVAIGTDAQDFYNRVWWTNDGGRSWTQGTPLQQVYDGVSWTFVGGTFDLGLDPVTGLGRAVAILRRGFIFATRDGGETWRVVARAPIFPPDADVKVVNSAVVGPDGRLYVGVAYNGTGREWVYRTVEPIGQAFVVAGEGTPEPSAGLSLSVRPNPASASVAVVVTTQESGAAVVVVLDALGREVARLHAGPLAAGETPFVLDTSGWATGVNVVRATVGPHTQTARLVVAR